MRKQDPNIKPEVAIKKDDSSPGEISILQKPVLEEIRMQPHVIQDELSKEFPIVTEAQKFVDHDSVIPKFIPKPIASEIIEKERKINETNKQELLAENEEDRREEKKKD